MTISNRLSVAVWAGVLFGLLEGVVLFVCRFYPAVLAPYKVTAAVLWVAPLLDALLFAAAALVLPLFLKPLRRFRWADGAAPVYGFFVFAGLSGAATAPRVLYPAAALLLAAGLTAVFCRYLPAFETRLTAASRKTVFLIPVLIGVLALGAAGHRRYREWTALRELPPPAPGPNVLVVVLDTVRYDTFRKSGSLTPNLHAVLEKALSYDNAWAASSWSLASQGSILTGRYPHQHGADWPRLELNRGSLTLAEFFRRRGYVTGAFSGNTAWVTPEYLGRGFLRFESQSVIDDFQRTVWGRKMAILLGMAGMHESGRGKKAPVINRQFLTFIDQYAPRPFFGYLCYMDANQSFYAEAVNAFWEPRPPVSALRAAYENGVQTLDRHLGDLFREFRSRGLMDRTIVVVTSDHGQSFGSELHTDHDPAGHGTSLYAEQTRVPLFVLVPGKDFQGARSSRTVSNAGIAATLSRLVGVEEAAFTVPVLPFPGNVAKRPPVLMSLNYLNRGLRAVAWNGRRYIRDAKAGGKEELYDILGDPVEKRNLASSGLTAGYRNLLTNTAGKLEGPER